MQLYLQRFLSKTMVYFTNSISDECRIILNKHLTLHIRNKTINLRRIWPHFEIDKLKSLKIRIQANNTLEFKYK